MKKYLLILMATLIWSCAETKEDEPTMNDTLIEVGKSEVMQNLKSPSTAEFIDSLTIVSQFRGDDKKHNVKLSVDAENSFGAVGRERYIVTIQTIGNDSLNKENYKVVGFQ